MIRISKGHRSKGAFTLAEIILVVAIILILASALMLGVKDFIDSAQAANDSIAEESQSLSQRVQDDEVSLASYNF